jgi:DNA-binding NarL/FixJ family response regulator
LDSWPGFKVIATASSKEEALELCRRMDSDLVLLSLPMEGDIADLNTIAELVRAAKGARILVLAGQSDTQLPIQMVLEGARGVVHKNKGPDELGKAILKVYVDKEIWLDRASLTTLIMQAAFGRRGIPTEKEISQLSVLTDRESEVVALVVKGCTNRKVGERLFISETTVRHHLTRIFNKLHVSGRYELLSYLHQNQEYAAKIGRSVEPARVLATARRG